MFIFELIDSGRAQRHSRPTKGKQHIAGIAAICQGAMGQFQHARLMEYEHFSMRSRCQQEQNWLGLQFARIVSSGPRQAEHPFSDSLIIAGIASPDNDRKLTGEYAKSH